MKIKQFLRIISRKSPLAMWQARYFQQLLLQTFPSCQTDIIGITTQGDKLLDSSLAKMGGKGLFVKELEQALLEGSADIAVHSMKDMTVDMPNGLSLAAILARENPRDAIVSKESFSISTLPEQARVGTSSLRRQAQLKLLRPDLQIQMLRGNVGTRLEKLDRGEYDAIVLASAGLTRLGLSDRIGYELSIDECLPAVGQGALGIQCPDADKDLLAMLSCMTDVVTQQCISAERAMNLQLNGGCQMPVAGHAYIEEGRLCLRGLIASPDGHQVVRASYSGSPLEAEKIGHGVAQDLLAKGGRKILESALQERN